MGNLTIKQAKLLVSSDLTRMLKRLVLTKSVLIVCLWMTLSHQNVRKCTQKSTFMW